MPAIFLDFLIVNMTLYFINEKKLVVTNNKRQSFECRKQYLKKKTIRGKINGTFLYWGFQKLDRVVLKRGFFWRNWQSQNNEKGTWRLNVPKSKVAECFKYQQVCSVEIWNHETGSVTFRGLQM